MTHFITQALIGESSELPHHLKKLFRSLLDALAKLLKLCYVKIDLHKLFLLSFRFFGSNPILRKRAFFSSMFPISHNKFYTTQIWH